MIIRGSYDMVMSMPYRRVCMHIIQHEGSRGQFERGRGLVASVRANPPKGSRAIGRAKARHAREDNLVIKDLIIYSARAPNVHTCAIPRVLLSID